MIKYSIIICSYNRYELLVETINSVLSVLGKRRDAEIIIIDNNSTDATSSLKDKYSSNKTVTYFLETIQGLSQARNRGMKEANGDVLIFFDDDIEIVENYFEICDLIFLDPSISISGGKVLPFKTDVPNWLPQNFYFLVSIYDMGDSSKFVKHLMGANFAIRRKDALKIGLFNTSLGRNGKILGGNEEVDYQNRASGMGYKINYHPKQNVFHKINEKLNEKYILTYSKELGKSGRIMDESISKFTVIKKTVMSYCAILVNVLLGGLITNERRKFYLKGIDQYSKGYLTKF